MAIKAKRNYVSECLSLRDATAGELAALSPTGRPSRILERMRRAGNALASNEALQKSLNGKPLREILLICEKELTGIEFSYKGVEFEHIKEES